MRAIFSASSPMRSRSVMVLVTAITRRRSLAAGWRRAMIWLHSSSMVTSSLLTLVSSMITASPKAVSPRTSALIACSICCSTSPPICRTLERMSSSSALYCWELCVHRGSIGLSCRGLAVAAGDVVFSPLVGRVGEDGVGIAEFHQLAQVHEGGVVGNARRLLHVVRHDQDRDLLLEF